MTSVLVVDSSAQVAALCDAGTDGEWAAEQLMRKDLAAPELIMFETANILRRLELTDGLPSAEAGHAHSDLLDLRMTLWPYAPMAQSVWRLRGSITCYVAAYVALAEHLDAPLVTLDHRLAGDLRGRLRDSDPSVVFAVGGDAGQCTVGATTRRTPAKPVDSAGRPGLNAAMLVTMTFGGHHGNRDDSAAQSAFAEGRP
ncbi:MAG: type II toxin-antitoxin system VapC family toxin [Actinomycetota bacterium]|nr:type II toxin-antitoxin system VapC family toxin [Actinomycetota bacterium]